MNRITGSTGISKSSIPIERKNNIEEYTKSTENYTAYQYYIKGRMEQIQYDVKNYPLAIEYYEKALKYDPKYALAWAGYLRSMLYGISNQICKWELAALS
jgi:tetratricopeptide (TPR) repeat protein